MSDDKEREDLEALLKAPGWLRFVNLQTRQWRDEYDAYVNKVAAETNDSQAMGKLRQIIAARAAVLAALRYPEDRLRQLHDAARTRAIDAESASMSRGGML